MHSVDAPSGGVSAPAGSSISGQALMPIVLLALFVVLAALGLAPLLRDDPRVLHDELVEQISGELAGGQNANIQQILARARAEGRLSHASVSNTRGATIASVGAPTDEEPDRSVHLRTDGAILHDGLSVGRLTMDVAPPTVLAALSGILLPALALTAPFIALLFVMRRRSQQQTMQPVAALTRGLDVLAQGLPASVATLPAMHPLAPLARAINAASEALQQSRLTTDEKIRQLGRVVRAHDEAEWEWQLNSGHTWYSSRFPVLLGYADDGAFRQQFNWSAATHPDDAATVRRARERLLSREIERSDDQIRLRARDGTYRWFRLRASVERDAQGSAVRLSGTLEDVTRERMTLDALRESEARLFHAVRGSFDGAWDWDIGAGRYFLSPRLSELLGLPQSMQPQTHDQLLERVHPDDLSRLQHAIDEHFLRRESFDIEYRMRHEAGHYLWVRNRGLATRSPKGKVLRFSGSITDITERKLAEHAVTTLAAEKQALFDDVPIAIVYVRDGTIADCNRRCEEIFDHPGSELIGKTISLFFPPQSDLPALLEGAARSAPQPFAQESVLQRRDGSALHAYVSVRQLEHDALPQAETIWIFSDDTARRRALDAARREENFSAALVRSMPGVFFLLDARGALRRWNENLQAVTGHGALDLVGKAALDLFPEESHALLRRQARRTLTSRDATFEAPLLSRSGEHLPHAFSLYRIDLDGLPHILGTGLDIRAQKDAERSVLALNQQLETRVRERTAELLTAMRELESFSYSVSHDLAAPLRGIDGFSRMIEEDFADRLDERGRGYLQRIRAATQRMHCLIDDLLGLARITRNEMHRQNVDVSALAHDIADELQRAEPERQTEFLIQPSMRVYADANLLRIAIENLLRNAWKFTARQDIAKIEIGCLRHDQELVYFVKDNGAGFDMRYASKLFGPFQRLHSAGEFSGSGIGLAIVHRIVLRHGGRIWAEAEVDHGACFHFTLEPVSI
ncbi:MAG: PAS domain S-box protein [Gammaproteobacteria bacterium]|nr:PAS domain S-box protein [Gammaproteobacteria bacterium]MBU0771424.1 PAS domain S-box protein [Gammaproteobacteria bacterium]MBU0854757.1 PAS domain S-box protein [Gammaproteobacteria bacterium]MBU1846892.1 PAS domain S-box protein [Gammaproteobacteria bacterium]